VAVVVLAVGEGATMVVAVEVEPEIPVSTELVNLCPPTRLRPNLRMASSNR